MMVQDHLMCVENLSVSFQTRDGPRKAVDDISFSLDKGEVLGIVGESGSGKSVTALSLIALVKGAGTKVGGRVLFDGVDLLGLTPQQMRRVRGRKISMIFQEPLSALNPAYTIGHQIAEAYETHGASSGASSHRRVLDLLKLVRIPDADSVRHRYPHEISGGMRQRVMIAMALAHTPSILIADEPTTALDVTIQAQVLNLIDQLRRELDLAVILITHDMGVVASYADRVLVMYGGRIVEGGPIESVFGAPSHPYTAGLFASIPRLGDRWIHGRRDLNEIPGVVPSIANIFPGCRFAPRCDRRMDVCVREAPALIPRQPGHVSACWAADGKSG